MNFSKYRAEQITLYGNPVSPSGQDREIGLPSEKSGDRVVRFYVIFFGFVNHSVP